MVSVMAEFGAVISPDSDVPEISAIVTCYNEEQSIDEFHRRLVQALTEQQRTFELIMVNDGSVDETFSRLRALFDAGPTVAVAIDLFRNAGQSAAITAGVTHARGRIILLMDSDLQLDPKDVGLLLAEYDKGQDVVSGYRQQRQDSPIRTIPSRLANAIMRRASRSELRDFGCTFKLFNGTLLRAFQLSPTRLFSPAQVIGAAAHVVDVPVSHAPRRYGSSGWTLAKLWDYNMDNVVAMLRRPFQIVAGGCLALGLLFALRISSTAFFDFSVLPTVTTGLLLNVAILSVLVTLGLLCLIGEFVVRNFIASQQLPKYIIRTLLSRHGESFGD
mgnify:CR=1 FL=1